MKMLRITVLGFLLATCLSPAYADFGGYLREDTASQARALGPFVDSTDGNTAEGGLTIANTDVKLSKAGGAFASKNSGGCTVDSSVTDQYICTFDATDTSTVGALVVEIRISGALVVKTTYQVVEEAVYDRDYAASGLAYVANQPVDVNTIKTQTVTLAGGITFPAATVASTTNITAASGVGVTSWNGVALGTTNPLPNAAAGASGGLIINGANSGATSFAGAWTLADLNVTAQVNFADGLDIVRSTGNSSALTLTGTGTGHGLFARSGTGATGNGAQFTSQATNGHGIGLTGVGTGVGMNGTISWTGAWDTEVQSEVDDALRALFLNELLAETYNPASEHSADSLFGDLTESDGGVTRFTTNALEQAPTGGGSSCPQDVVCSTVASAPSATTITLDDPPTADTQLPGWAIKITDNGDAGAYSVRKITSVSSGTITYDSAADFTVAAGDVVELLPAFLDENVHVDTADFFTVDSGEDSGSAVAGSVVAEVGALAAGGGVTDDSVADEIQSRFPTIFDAATSGHTTSGTFGERITRIPNAAAGAQNGLPILDANGNVQADVEAIDDDATAASGTVTFPNATLASTTGAVGSVTGAVASVTGNVGGNVTGSVGSVVGAVGSVTGLTASDVGAIKTKTDSLTFTVAGVVDSNVKRINGVTIAGDGSGTPFHVSYRSLRRQMRDAMIEVSNKKLRRLRKDLNESNGAPQVIQVAL